ncbi:hypothetical protein BDV96DRAFT_464939, partial [Lophiotrema nucula]
LKLPGEVRNIIYRYVLDLNNTQKRIPRHGDDPKPRAEGFDLLGTCRQIAVEARTMFESEATVYIPIEGAMKFNLLIDWVNKDDPSRLIPVQNTILVALSSSMRVHMHLHTTWEKAKAPAVGRYRLPVTTGLIFGRLRQAVLIFVSNSAALVQSHGGTKRKAFIHLDHLFSD